MKSAYRFAEGLGPTPSLPDSLIDIERRAQLVKAVNRPFAGERFPLDPLALIEEISRNIGESTSEMAATSAPYMPEVADPLIRVNITLRLWAGCLSAAKTIAENTRSGLNTPDVRTHAFASEIDPMARTDPLYEAGVEAAPAFKRLHNQSYSFDGVPQDSAVRRFADA